MQLSTRILFDGEDSFNTLNLPNYHLFAPYEETRKLKKKSDPTKKIIDLDTLYHRMCRMHLYTQLEK